ncbi:MAG: glycosyltransferase family 2 protein [Alphaproteobacteria bacterium]|nr:glycosyltransferase family 2 protein [Alphaproteobacteria bacterium]
MSNKTAPFQSLTKQLNRPGFPIAAQDRLVSVIISVADEAGNILPLAQEITTVLETLPVTKNNYELIFVDDHSVDPTTDEIQQAMRRFPHIRLICHQARYGKSQGVWTGLRHARGEWIITMDGDGQNDPADIPRLLTVALESNPFKNVLVSGVRVNRAATGSKRFASRFANGLRRFLLQDDCPDTGCALKVFRRDAYLALPYFDNIHRYEPTLFKLYGHDVVYIPVNDRQRKHGTSKYTNFKRALDGLFDLFGVMWLQQRYNARNEQSIEIVTIADIISAEGANAPRREQATR